MLSHASTHKHITPTVLVVKKLKGHLYAMVCDSLHTIQNLTKLGWYKMNVGPKFKLTNLI